METKTDILNKIDQRILTEFLIKLNNSPRYDLLSKNRDEFLKYASNKLTRRQALGLMRGISYQGKTIDDLVTEIREKSGWELRDAFMKSLGNVPMKKEFSAGNRLVDLVYLDSGDLTAVEIKANGDKIEAAKKQCADYSKWANYVYLLVEGKKEAEVKRANLEDYVGVMVYKDGKFKKTKGAMHIDHEALTYVDLMNSNSLRDLTKALGIKASSSKDAMRENINRFFKTTAHVADRGKLSKKTKKCFLGY